MTAPIDFKRARPHPAGLEAGPTEALKPGSPPQWDSPSGADWLKAYGALRRLRISPTSNNLRRFLENLGVV
ncbi:hypothetical protein HD806DRAFT_532187 [Xylariaceae sp. AK1471]|nr:hypothetical protein HD806DRAFT_532187 [Xylariaceae sp. AK1471]